MNYERLGLLAPRNKSLTTPCETVTDIETEVRPFMPYLIRIMRNEDGMGICANQVGLNKSVFVMNVPGDYIKILINPTLLELNGPTMETQEGCLTFPGKFLTTQRKRHAVVHAFNLKGEQFILNTDYEYFTEKTSMLLSACIQHEMDHINGIDMREYL